LEHDGQKDLGLNKLRSFSGANLKITEEQKLPTDKKNNEINNISIFEKELRFINNEINNISIFEKELRFINIELLMLFNYLFFCNVKTK